LSLKAGYLLGYVIDVFLFLHVDLILLGLNQVGFQEGVGCFAVKFLKGTGDIL
jgi:hypothetical protein